MLSASYPPVLGGLQTAVHALARQFVESGHAVRVVANRYPRALPTTESLDGVPVQRQPFLTPNVRHLRGGRLDLFAAGLYCLPVVRRRLRRLVGAFDPDVVNVHFPDAQIPFLAPLCRRRRFRLVVSLHGDDIMRFTSDEGAKSAPARGLRTLLDEADAVTACSRDLLERAARLAPSVAAKGTAIANGIDPARFHDRTPHSHGRPYVLALGRLTHKKGFDLLLEAFARTAALSQGVDLLLAGEGEERPALETLVRRLGLEGRVRFLGKATPAEVVRLLNGCRFLAIPSRAEPFGIVALEGLAAGKPVLATRVGGMGELLAEVGRRFAVAAPATLTPANVEGIAEGLRRRLESETSAGDLEEIRNAVLNEYSWAAAGRNYLRVLRPPGSEPFP
jgi:glycosyltransferase involved in cell wall biosynthesis